MTEGNQMLMERDIMIRRSWIPVECFNDLTGDHDWTCKDVWYWMAKMSFHFGREFEFEMKEKKKKQGEREKTREEELISLQIQNLLLSLVFFLSFQLDCFS